MEIYLNIRLNLHPETDTEFLLMMLAGGDTPLFEHEVEAKNRELFNTLEFLQLPKKILNESPSNVLHLLWFCSSSSQVQEVINALTELQPVLLLGYVEHPDGSAFAFDVLKGQQRVYHSYKGRTISNLGLDGDDEVFNWLAEVEADGKRAWQRPAAMDKCLKTLVSALQAQSRLPKRFPLKGKELNDIIAALFERNPKYIWDSEDLDIGLVMGLSPEEIDEREEEFEIGDYTGIFKSLLDFAEVSSSLDKVVAAQRIGDPNEDDTAELRFEWRGEIVALQWEQAEDEYADSNFFAAVGQFLKENAGIVFAQHEDDGTTVTVLGGEAAEAYAACLDLY